MDHRPTLLCLGWKVARINEFIGNKCIYSGVQIRTRWQWIHKLCENRQFYSQLKTVLPLKSILCQFYVAKKNLRIIKNLQHNFSTWVWQGSHIKPIHKQRREYPDWFCHRWLQPYDNLIIRWLNRIIKRLNVWLSKMLFHHLCVADSKSQKKTYSLITAVITQAKGSRLTSDGAVWSKRDIF